MEQELVLLLQDRRQEAEAGSRAMRMPVQRRPIGAEMYRHRDMAAQMAGEK